MGSGVCWPGCPNSPSTGDLGARPGGPSGKPVGSPALVQCQISAWWAQNLAVPPPPPRPLPQLTNCPWLLLPWPQAARVLVARKQGVLLLQLVVWARRGRGSAVGLSVWPVLEGCLPVVLVQMPPGSCPSGIPLDGVSGSFVTGFLCL